MFEGELSSDPFPRRGRFGFGPMKSLKDQRETSERRRQTVSLSVVGAELIFDNTVRKPNRFDGVLRLTVLAHRKRNGIRRL